MQPYRVLTLSTELALTCAPGDMGWVASTVGHLHLSQHAGTEQRVCLCGPHKHHEHHNTRLAEHATGM